jgi:hypothetical protein
MMKKNKTYTNCAMRKAGKRTLSLSVSRRDNVGLEIAYETV